MGERARRDHRARDDRGGAQDATAQMRGIVLDTGALLALKRNDRAMWAALKVAANQNIAVIVPSTALAQAWRGGASQARLAAALKQCTVAPFEPVARRVGVLCG